MFKWLNPKPLLDLQVWGLSRHSGENSELTGEETAGWRGGGFKVWCNDRLVMLFETSLVLCTVISHFWVASADTRVDFNVRSILQARSHLPFLLRCRPSQANASSLFHSPAPAGCRTSDPSSACWRLPTVSGRPVWCPAWAPRWFPLRDRK